MNRNAVAAFIRFVICGGGVGLLSSGALMLLTGSMSIAVANAVVTVVSTLLCNELHSRITFRKGAASFRVHVESTGTAVVAYLFTTTAMLVLDAVAPHAGALTQQAVYLSASGLAGLGRFVVLRLVVFARKADKVAVVVTPAPAAAVAATAIGSARTAVAAIGAGANGAGRMAAAATRIATAPVTATAGIVSAARNASAGALASVSALASVAARASVTAVASTTAATSASTTASPVASGTASDTASAFTSVTVPSAVPVRAVRPAVALAAVNGIAGTASGTRLKGVAGAKTWKSREPRAVVFGALVPSGGRTTIPAREELVAAA